MTDKIFVAVISGSTADVQKVADRLHDAVAGTQLELDLEGVYMVPAHLREQVEDAVAEHADSTRQTVEAAPVEERRVESNVIPLFPSPTP